MQIQKFTPSDLLTAKSSTFTICNILLMYLFILFFDTGSYSVCGFGCPEAHYVDQAGIEILLPLPL